MTALPYGSWPSPLRASDLAGASVRLSEVAVVGGDTFWTEGRASEQGRTVLMRRDASGDVTRVSPEQAPDGEPFDVRSRAQEYGGGVFSVAGDMVVASRKEDDRLYRFALDGSGATPLTPADGGRYADLSIDAGRGLVYAVLEDHGEAGGFRTDPTISLVAVPLDGSAAASRSQVREVFAGTDFVNAPRLSPDGRYLAFVTWDHPNMPWDGSIVHVAELATDGTLRSRSVAVAGGDDVSAQEPVWTPAGDLVHVDDRSGWWNVYRTELSTPEGWLELRTRHLHPAQVEFSAPQWVFGPRTIAVLDEDHLVLSWVEEGRRRLGTMRLLNGELEAWVGEWEPAGAIAAATDRVVFVGAHPRRPGAVVELELAGGTTTVLASSTRLEHAEARISEAEPVSWDAGDGVEAHGFYYPPALAGTAGPEGDLPPLLVMIHGGPTSATSP
ncbi:TolB family protein, partial [Pseudactinotalea sp.]|uniref:TolB family protein n=1 Tax=Pseudactinotalea sp. TaxID=1926260 RepID=UPI003B3BB29A